MHASYNVYCSKIIYFEMANLITTIIIASERAANVARSCCVVDSACDEIFISEKHDGEANTRFEKDFKTIADVLAQESAKEEISKHFPELSKYVRGEEASEIGGVSIGIKEDAEKTAELLSLLVPIIAAKRMAQAAHCEVNLDLCKDIPQNLPDIISDLGFWIDPIDGTAEFIAGVQGKANADKGLPCVTVLIGAYLRSTGEPVLGVINQPFYNQGKGRIIWGISYNGIQQWGGNDIKDNSKSNVVLVSGAETIEVKQKIRNAGWDIISLPGAGHKFLKVATAEAAAYVVSKGTTFRWDTCGPHAILKAMGGNLLSYISHIPLSYNDPESNDIQLYCNSEGIIAYSDQEVFNKLKNILD